MTKTAVLDLPKASEDSGLIRGDTELLFSERDEPVGSSKEETRVLCLSGDPKISGILGKSSIVSPYYSLTKPGIIRGNLITAAAGYLFATQGSIVVLHLAVTLIGITLVVASGCVFNNYIDRHIDAQMLRTKKRALVTGLISPRDALTVATLLGLVGFSILMIYTNFLTVLVGAFGLLWYVVIYGFFKRWSVYGTEVGSIAGAIPITAGYLAVTNHIDAVVLSLFLILVFWQMPHFYAISIYRINDYRKALIPVLPVKKNLKTTKIRMLLYIISFIVMTSALTVYGFTGTIYLLVVGIIGGVWLGYALYGFKAANSETWARKMFHVSLLVLMVFSLMISIDVFLA